MQYLILQYPYDCIELALCKQGSILYKAQESKLHSVALTIPHIENLLKTANFTLQDISFIAVNTGPGPYNTLRSLITTANGIHFAQKTPLIELGALDLLISEYKKPTLAILNAFANHVFYAFSTETNNEQGYCSIDKLIQKINEFDNKLLLIGNGVELHKETLLKKTHNITMPDTIPGFNSLETLAQHAYEASKEAKYASSYIMPKYLHSPAIKKRSSSNN